MKLTATLGVIAALGVTLATALVIRQRWFKPTPKDYRSHPAFTRATETPGLPNVLIIGDSISIGYTSGVRAALANEANVFRVPANAGATDAGLRQMRGWLGGRRWSVVVFNFGLHDLRRDLRRDRPGEVQVERETYAANLRAILEILQPTGARLLWATTTPVPAGTKEWHAGDERAYNELASAIMRSAGVTVVDLHTAVLSRLTELQFPQDVHFNPKGDAFLAGEIVDALRPLLPNRP